MFLLHLSKSPSEIPVHSRNRRQPKLAVTIPDEGRLLWQGAHLAVLCHQGTFTFYSIDLYLRLREGLLTDTYHNAANHRQSPQAYAQRLLCRAPDAPYP